MHDFEIISIPCLLILLGMFFNWREAQDIRSEMRANFLDVKKLIQHLTDLHINHAERIATLEERTKK